MPVVLTPYGIILSLLIFYGVFGWFMTQAGYIKFVLIDPVLFTGILIILTTVIGFIGEIELFGFKITSRQVAIASLLTWIVTTFLNIQIPSTSSIAPFWYVIFGIMVLPAIIVMALYFMELAK